MEFGGSPDRYSYLHPNPDGTSEIDDLSEDPTPTILPPDQTYLGGFNNDPEFPRPVPAEDYYATPIEVDPEFTRPVPPEDNYATPIEVDPEFTRPVRGDGRKAPNEDYARRIAPSELACPLGLPGQEVETQSRLDQLAERGIVEVAWKATAVAAGTINPAAYIAVQVAYHVVNLAGALRGLNNGDGFLYKAQIAELPVPMIGVAVTVRLGGHSRPGSDLGLRLDVNAFNPLLFDTVDLTADDALERVAQFPEGEWPGEWMTPYGMAGIHNHGLVLEYAGRWRAPTSR
jgi:hypothetical protein